MKAVSTARGRGKSFKTAAVMIPSVPSAPMSQIDHASTVIILDVALRDEAHEEQFLRCWTEAKTLLWHFEGARRDIRLRSRRA